MSAHEENAVQISGMLDDMLYMGMEPKHIMGERFDNPLDAGARTVRITINTETNELTCADDAPGMTVQQLVDSRKIYNSKLASNDRNGRFGVGGTLSDVCLTRHNHSSTRLTKMTCDPNVYQVVIDWKHAHETNTMPLHGHEATARNEEAWRRLSIVPTHGTVDIVKCEPFILARIVDDINSGKMIQFLKMTYESYIVDGVVLEIWVDGVCTRVEPNKLFPDGEANHRKHRTIEVYENPLTKKLRVYFNNGKGRLVYWDPIKKKQGKDDDDQRDTLGLVKKGVIHMESRLQYIYTPKGKPIPAGNPPNWTEECGGYYLRRCKKVVQRFPGKVPTSGDFGRRTCFAAARHLYTFDTALDDEFGVEVNKSVIKFDNIRYEILTTLMHLADDFSKRVWDGQSSDDETSVESTTEDENVIVGTPVEATAAAAARTIVRRAINPRVAAPAAEPAAAPHARPPSPSPAPAATAAVTHVAPHTRTTPKSQKELVAALLELQRELRAMDLQACFESASNMTDSKYREPFKQVMEILSLVKGMSQS
jgi:hypothetical protein